MFDEDLTSLYPSIIMTLNIGRETMIGKIIPKNLDERLENFGPYQRRSDRNNYLGLNDLKQLDPDEMLSIADINNIKLFFIIVTKGKIIGVNQRKCL
jgi:hypothetical protein